MIGRSLARQDELQADEDRRRRLDVLEPKARIGERQDAALGFFNRRQVSGLEQVRPRVAIAPDHRLGAAVGFIVRQRSAHLRPQRHEDSWPGTPCR